MALRFDDRVAIVTGSGNGIGRAYAMELASRGCKVVVNDIGSGPDGDGSSGNFADQVVAEIRANGGEAVASYDSVEEAAKIVAVAIENYGRVDILINNAGFLRDISFQKMTDRHWYGIFAIHLRAAFLMAKECWPYMKKQNYGRIINTTSSCGVYGNFGQANYSAAKLGLHGFTRTLSLEGAKTNMHTNTIAPVAASRLTANSWPQEFKDMLPIKYIVPYVVYLCHESCNENGSLFELGGGFIGKMRLERSKGAYFRGDFGPEQIRDSWPDITDFDSETGFPDSVNDNFFVKVVQLEEEDKQQAKL